MSKCIVFYVDSDGFEHRVEVEAASLYEAIAMSIRKFREHGLDPSVHTKMHVEVISSIEHVLTVKQFQDWLKRPGRVPKEITEKDRLNKILEPSN